MNKVILILGKGKSSIENYMYDMHFCIFVLVQDISGLPTPLLDSPMFVVSMLLLCSPSMVNIVSHVEH